MPSFRNKNQIMKKKLNLSAKPLSFISIDEQGRNSYCKSHCLKYDQFEFRNNLCFLSCSIGECILDNEPLSKDEIVSILRQIQAQIISDEYKQQQKQKINSQKEDVKLFIEQFCDRLIQQLDKNCELQNQLNEKIKSFLENQDQINYFDIYEILKQQQLENVGMKVTVNSTLAKEFNKTLTKYDLILRIIQQITMNDDTNRKDENVLQKQLDLIAIKDSTYQKQHEISIKQNKNSIQRIYEDLKNKQLVVINQSADSNSQITIIQPSKYSLFGEFETLKNLIPVECFAISPSGQFYAWSSNNKIQIYSLVNKNYLQLTNPSMIDQISFNIFNELAASTQDQKIYFWGIVEKMWENTGSFNMLPERVFELVFIENGKKLMCQSPTKLTILIKENKNWIIHQQIHQGFGQVFWSPVFQMIVSTNLKQQIQFWTKNKRDFYSISQTEWDIDYNDMQNQNSYQINEDGTLLFQNKGDKIRLWMINNDGKMEQIFEQNVIEKDLKITSDFTNIIAQTDKSLIWYQLINDD